MDDAHSKDRMEEAFRLARLEDKSAFAEWMGMVEIPLRRSLHRFARVVDVESAIQETFLRMWRFALGPDRQLSGANASLKFALRVARNVALEEIRRYKKERFVDLSELENNPEGQDIDALPDPALRRAIKDCLMRLSAQPRKALLARIHYGGKPDRDHAGSLQMKLNTFLQNIVRARQLLRECLEKRGVHLKEVLS